MDDRIMQRIDNSEYRLSVVKPIRAKSSGVAVETFTDAGFTMVELIVVVAIMAILMIIALPSFNDYRYRTQKSRAELEIRNIEKEIISYFLERNAYPQDLNVVGQGTQKDPWGNPYRYRNNVGGGALPFATLKDSFGTPINEDFDLYSLGSDGVTNTEDPDDPLSEDDIARSGDGGFVGLR